jgi:hypothetical protein
MANEPVVGELLPVPYVPAPEQPGGVGTPVTDPVQMVSEKNGFYYPACGHSINSYDVSCEVAGGAPYGAGPYGAGNYSQQGQASAIVKCPICGYVQQIITPASAFYNMPGQQILLA